MSQEAGLVTKNAYASQAKYFVVAEALSFASLVNLASQFDLGILECSQTEWGGFLLAEFSDEEILNKIGTAANGVNLKALRYVNKEIVKSLYHLNSGSWQKEICILEANSIVSFFEFFQNTNLTDVLPLELRWTRLSKSKPMAVFKSIDFDKLNQELMVRPEIKNEISVQRITLSDRALDYFDPAPRP